MTPLVHRVYIATLAGIVAFATFYLGYKGYSYYSTPFEERFYHPDHDQFKPSGIYGHGGDFVDHYRCFWVHRQEKIPSIGPFWQVEVLVGVSHFSVFLGTRDDIVSHGIQIWRVGFSQFLEHGGCCCEWRYRQVYLHTNPKDDRGACVEFARDSIDERGSSGNIERGLSTCGNQQSTPCGSCDRFYAPSGQWRIPWIYWTIFCRTKGP